jgi:hypothetical protein
MAGYGDDTAFSAWLTDNGRTLPDGSPSAAVLRQRGSVYVDGTYGLRFPGTPTGGADQERAWPRTGATDRWGNALNASTVPTRVIHASFEAAWAEASSPGSLVASGSSVGRVKREKVEGAVEVEYQSSSGSAGLVADLTPMLTAVEGLLGPLLAPLNIPYAVVV